MINKKIENENDNKLFNVKVTKAHYLKNEENEQVISFDMVVNHINIYGAIYRAGTSKKVEKQLVGSLCKRHAVVFRLRPLVNERFQVLFHSPVRGASHLSLTVLVHYRSSGYI